MKSKSIIVDVRSAEPFEKGHIEGSINIPLLYLPYELEKLREYEQVILVCQTGNSSAKAKDILEKEGFVNVIDEGKWEEYLKNINS